MPLKLILAKVQAWPVFFNGTIMLMKGSDTNSKKEVIDRGGTHVGWYFQALTVALVCSIVIVNSFQQTTSAYLTQRSLTTSSSLPGAVNNHTFQFDILGTPSIGSIAFEYCSNSPLVTVPCDAPLGLSSSSAVLTSQLGETGFSVHPDTTSTPNRVILTRPAALAAPGTSRYSFSTITNPNASLGTNYVRITTYPTTDGSGIFSDSGSVTFSVQSALTVSVYVPPFLILCTGVTVDLECASTSGVTVDLGELSKVSPNSATTQFSVATNSLSGYVASMQGSTFTAGNRTIPALVASSTSQAGVSQYGVNLRSNTNPSIGSDVVGNGTGTVNANYSTPNLFRFQNGDIIASSSLPTEWNRYTISYIVNVADGQPAGRYASTLTVIATTTF